MLYLVEGYLGTGSSAIVEILEGYVNCTTAKMRNQEQLLLYTPHGLFDLEEKLLNNNTIHNSDVAIDEFYLEMKRLNDNDFNWFGGYKKRYGQQFMDLVDEFLEGIVDFKLRGCWSCDCVENRRTLKGCIKELVGMRKHNDLREFGKQIILKQDNVIKYSFISRDEFYNKAKKFVKGYCEMVRQGDERDLIINQFMLPHNIHRAVNYFEEDYRIIVCSRDARDMFVLSKYIWPQFDATTQYFPEGVSDFCKFYRGLRNIEQKYDNRKVMQVNFEDFIYKNKDTIIELEKFLGLCHDKFDKLKTMFDPQKSINNTQNFRIKEEWMLETEVIKNELPDLIYEFPYTFKPDTKQIFDR